MKAHKKQGVRYEIIVDDKVIECIHEYIYLGQE